MNILRQVEIVIFMAFFFAELIPSFAQYEMKASEAMPFRGSILKRIVRTATSSSTRFPIYFRICEEMNILRQVEIVIFMAIFFAESMLYFAQYERKSSEATPFRGSILMRFRLLEPPQVLLHAPQFAFKSVKKGIFCNRLKL